MRPAIFIFYIKSTIIYFLNDKISYICHKHILCNI